MNYSFLQGANMKSMAKFYSSIYDNFDMDRFAELTKTFGLDPSKSNIKLFKRNEETGSYNTCAFNQSQVYVL